MLGGMLFGGMILLFCILSRGKMGPGDGIVFMLTGLYLGAEENLALMLLSFFFAAGWSFIAICFFHRNKKEKIPFIPFLLPIYKAFDCYKEVKQDSGYIWEKNFVPEEKIRKMQLAEKVWEDLK